MAKSKSISGSKPNRTGANRTESRTDAERLQAGARPNLVPINLEDEIRVRAYELYQQRGGGAGSESEDWLAAEREVQQRYHQQSA
ncbi:MAG: DUF2934 domain-containing protein [Candidatus Sulfotelmatobacter sp.]